MNPNALEMKGQDVRDTDGTKVGEVVDFYFDSDSNEPEWLVVETGLTGQKLVLVPMADATRDEDGLTTPYPKDMITDSPEVEGDAMDEATERALYEYYHLRRELPGRTEQMAAFDQDRSAIRDRRLRSWKAWAA